MPGTSTIPPFSGAANRRLISISMVDVSFDEYTEAIVAPAAATDAQIQAFLDAYQSGTQASTYRLRDTFIYQGAKLASNATDDQRSEVQNGINLLFRNTANLDTETVRLVAPITGVMVGETDIPDMTATEIVAIGTSLNGIDSDLTLESGQYTVNSERSGRNDRVPA